MKKTVFLFSFVLVITLVACSSPEAKDLKKYHNDYAAMAEVKHEKIYKLLTRAQKTTDLKKEYIINKGKVKPLVNEAHQFVMNLKPKTNAVKELHSIRVNEYDTWKKAFDTRLKALKLALDTSLENPKVIKLLDKFNNKIAESNNLGLKAKKKLLELVEEYGVDIEEIEKKNIGLN